MPVGIIAAGIGAAGAVGSALITSHTASNNANIAAQTAAANNALQSQIYNSNKAMEEPYVTSGNTAETGLNGFLGLGGDPAATQKAFQDYLNSTGYQFALNQGEAAAEQNGAARGQLDSGGTLKALDAYGTGLAQQYGQNYINNLLDETKVGAGSAAALANSGQAYANASNTNSNSAATGQIAANNQKSNAFSGAVNQIAGLAGGLFGGSGSPGVGTSPNAFSPSAPVDLSSYNFGGGGGSYYGATMPSIGG